jgi:hypothetical protein
MLGALRHSDTPGIREMGARATWSQLPEGGLNAGGGRIFLNIFSWELSSGEIVH